MTVAINQVSYAYQTTDVVNQCSLKITANECVGIVGESGSGKTTLLKMMSGLLAPNQGSVMINEQTSFLDGKRNKNLYNQVGVIFQDYQLFDHFTVVENVALAYRLTKKVSKAQSFDVAKTILESLGLKEVMNQFPYECSGGQQQRIAIARALILEPSILLVDEPTSALDQENTYKLVDTLKKLNQEGLTIVVITHDLPFAKLVCNRIIEMKQGKITADCATNEFFKRV
jgi:polar amino acid transport system ATP-binding protein